MKEIMKLNASKELVVRDPFDETTYHNAANVSAMISSANARVVMRRKQFDDLGDLCSAPIQAVRELRRAIEDDDKALKDFDGDAKDALLDFSGFRAYVVQTKGTGARIDPLSVRGKFAVMLKALKEREDAERPPEPTHTYVVRINCTDKMLNALLTKAIKDGATDVLAATPQSDKAVKEICKWFEVNV